MFRGPISAEVNDLVGSTPTARSRTRAASSMSRERPVQANDEQRSALERVRSTAKDTAETH
jgi:hypothetical protein